MAKASVSCMQEKHIEMPCKINRIWDKNYLESNSLDILLWHAYIIPVAPDGICCLFCNVHENLSIVNYLSINHLYIKICSSY